MCCGSLLPILETESNDEPYYTIYGSVLVLSTLKLAQYSCDFQVCHSSVRLLNITPPILSFRFEQYTELMQTSPMTDL